MRRTALAAMIIGMTALPCVVVAQSTELEESIRAALVRAGASDIDPELIRALAEDAAAQGVESADLAPPADTFQQENATAHEAATGDAGVKLLRWSGVLVLMALVFACWLYYRHRRLRALAVVSSGREALDSRIR